jgi:ubiquitin-like 1-activating enzyme E1 B
LEISNLLSEYISDIEILLGTKGIEKLHKLKVLIIGAGGIGCELLKMLSKINLEKIETIDLDTIDKTNLNRQLLFRPQHVGQPKATVATQTALNMRPNFGQFKNHTVFANNIVGKQANVFDSLKPCDIENFDMVVLGLDNVAARSHVARMCLSKNTVILNAGSTGMNGQASCHIPKVTEC